MIVVDGVRYEPEDLTDDFATQFNHAVSGRPRLVQIFGEHEILSSLNLTQKRHGMTVDFAGANLTAKMRGGIVVDMTDSSGITIIGLRLGTEGLAWPDIGLLQSRAGGEQRWRTAGKHRFERITIGGHYNIAAVYSIAAENSVWFAPRIDNRNSAGVAAIYLARRNVHGVASAHDLNPDNGSRTEKTGASASGQIFFALHTVCEVTETETREKDTKGSVVINGHSRATFYAPYIASRCAPHVLIDCSTESVVGPELHEIHTHGAASGKPEVAIKIVGNFNMGVHGVRVLARRMAADKHAIKIGTNDLLNCDFYWTDGLPVEIDSAARLVGCTFRRRGESIAVDRP